jgi:gliding motility-associated lipoprotein GldH
MKRFIHILCPAACLLISILLGSCTDPNAVTDTNTQIVDHNWSYVNRVKFDFNIADTKPAYNLYFNLRVTDAYKYANVFVLIHETSPNGYKKTTRYELKLASHDGEWLGKGSGNLYSYQVPFQTNVKFAQAGKYHIEIEQNMRDNPLHEVSDVGIRVEVVK